MKYSLGDKHVQLRGGGHFIAPNAAVIGDVILEQDVSVWFAVVIRGDSDTITIGAGSNIQDGTVLHADAGSPLNIGRNVTVGHNAMVHGCTIGDGTLIGINSVILNGAKIGRGCLVGANALVPEGMVVPDGSMVLGSPARIKRELDEEAQAMLVAMAGHYVKNGSRFERDLKEQD